MRYIKGMNEELGGISVTVLQLNGCIEIIWVISTN